MDTEQATIAWSSASAATNGAESPIYKQDNWVATVVVLVEQHPLALLVLACFVVIGVLWRTLRIRNQELLDLKSQRGGARRVPDRETGPDT